MKKGFFASKNSKILIRFLLIIIDLFSLLWTLTRKLNFNRFFIHVTSMRVDLNCSYAKLVSNKIGIFSQFAGSAYFCGFPLQTLRIPQISRQNLRDRYWYAEFIEVLQNESTYLLEHV